MCASVAGLTIQQKAARLCFLVQSRHDLAHIQSVWNQGPLQIWQQHIFIAQNYFPYLNKWRAFPPFCGTWKSLFWLISKQNLHWMNVDIITRSKSDTDWFCSIFGEYYIVSLVNMQLCTIKGQSLGSGSGQYIAVIPWLIRQGLTGFQCC